jgi:hypothetical protein
MTETTPNPPAIGQVFEPQNIPRQLKALRRWAPWKAIWNSVRGKWDKVPYHPGHYGLSTKDVNRWVDFETANAAYQRNRDRYHGVGLVLTGIGDVVGIDLDDCISNGEVRPWAAEIISAMDSYTERSPSGQGIRILATGTFHSDWNNHDVGIEVYAGHAPRFLTITGDELPAAGTGALPGMREAPAEVMGALYSRYGRGRATANVIPIQMPELIPDVLLPDVEEMDIPESTKDILLHGPDEAEDRSLALHRTGVQLYSAGYSDAEVLSILANSQPLFDVALSHRRNDDERALQYLWVEHCQKAKPKAVTKDSVLADFDDLSSDPEVAVQLKKADEAKARAEDRFKLETAAEFAKRRKASWIVKGVVPMATLGVVYGASGSGKSFWLFDLMAAVSRAADQALWRGHKINPARVCWIAAEGVEDMRKRVLGYCTYQGILLADLPMEFVGEAPNFMEPVDVKAVIRQIRARGRFDVIVVDTLAQVMSGGNENSGEDMGQVLGYCRDITRLTGAMVVLVHHSGKDESRGARGWSGLRAAADFEFEIIRSDNDRVATVTKMKGGEDGGEYGFQLQTVAVGTDEDGDVETTCVVSYTDSSRASVAATKGPTGARHRLILTEATRLIDLAGGTGAGVSFSEIVEVVWPQYPRGDESKRDQRKTNAARDLRDVIAAGFLAQNDAGVVRLPGDGGL